jgi:LacI family transcriptional regulator
MLNNIENRAYERGYFVNINLQEENKEKEIQLINSMVDRRVDGIILCPVNKGPEFEQFLLSLPIPVVVIGNYISERIPFVGINEKQAANEGVDILIKKGYKKIIFVCPPFIYHDTKNLYTHEQRVAGFQERVTQENGIDAILLTGMDYIDKLKKILADNKNKIKTAIFCSGDIYALTIIKYFHEWNLKIPRDIGIMGFDNIHILEYIYPPLSTISNSVEQVAVTAVDNLIKLINNEKSENKILLDYKIIAGSSI